MKHFHLDVELVVLVVIKIVILLEGEQSLAAPSRLSDSVLYQVHPSSMWPSSLILLKKNLPHRMMLPPACVSIGIMWALVFSLTQVLTNQLASEANELHWVLFIYSITSNQANKCSWIEQIWILSNWPDINLTEFLPTE